ncbi:hypothetical protein LCGC14_2093980, partial [marine sediment metagenome]
RDKTKLITAGNVTSRDSNATEKNRIEEEENRKEDITDINNHNKNELIDGQTIEKAIQIARGELPALPRAVKRFQSELESRGISWEKNNVERI